MMPNSILNDYWKPFFIVDEQTEFKAEIERAKQEYFKNGGTIKKVETDGKAESREKTSYDRDNEKREHAENENNYYKRKNKGWM